MDPLFRIGVMLIPIIWGSSVHAAGDPGRGQTLYQSRCATCHSLDYNGVGPAHRNVYGRKAGSAPNYDYSPAVRASTIVWSEATLQQWLTNPESLIPGQKMGYSVPDAQDREDLIEYLRQQSGR